MNRYYYDLHIHSCLSPCADDEATPANIAGIAALNGLQIAALTDHNTTRNCPAFCEAAKHYGLIPIPGMELTTSEDIHVICLFRTLEAAVSFDRVIAQERVRVRNRPEIFGDQLVMDADDTILDHEQDLLINETRLSLKDAFLLCQEYGGVCYPAHIDRSSNGILAALGAFPDVPRYTAYELNRADAGEEYRNKYPNIRELSCVVSSDAHALENISEAKHFFELEDEPYSSRLVIENLFAFLQRKHPNTEEKVHV